MKKIITILLILGCTFCLFGQEILSDEDYFTTYITKLNKTQKRLTYMNKKGSLAKVGTETINGQISGTLFYDVKIKGLGAVVTLKYDNFCEEEGWIFDGEIITKSNMAQNGTLDGIVKVSGNYPGAVYYEKAILKDGKPGDGTYGVEQSGKERKEVPYSLYFEAKEE